MNDLIRSFEFRSPRNYLAIIAVFILLCFLAFMEVMLIKGIHSFNLKLIVVVLLFSLYALFVARTLFWMLFGKEQIEITASDLIIRKKGTFFVRPQSFHLEEIKNLRMENRKFSFLDFLVSRSVLTSLKSYGCIAFDCKGRKVSFGGNLDDSKVKELLAVLNSRIINSGI